MKSYRLGVLVIVGFLVLTGFVTAKKKQRPKIDEKAMLDRHNYYREKVGVPPLEWSDELADYAQSWADHLAKSCDMYHSKGEYGENIYWTSGSSDAGYVVDYWADEERYFNHKNRAFKSSKSRKYGHYTQMIWKNTTHVGGAMQKCKHGGEIWVCSYDPHGNIIGQKVY